MLKISKMADYATVVMESLARSTGSVRNAKDIAEDTHLSVPTVSKLLKLLAAANLLQSQRGAKGGYALAREAETISVADIIEAVEGQAGLTECSISQGECSIETQCSIRSNWQLISRAIYTALDSVTLSALAKPRMTEYSVNVNTIERLNHKAIIIEAEDV